MIFTIWREQRLLDDTEVLYMNFYISSYTGIIISSFKITNINAETSESVLSNNFFFCSFIFFVTFHCSLFFCWLYTVLV